MDKSASIFVAGHRGLVGSALVRALEKEGFHNIITKTRSDLDLRNQAAVDGFFAEARPAYVLLAAAKVGGILANDSAPADFIRDNLLIQSHVIDAAHRYSSKKLLYLGSSCIYPKHAEQPMHESELLTGPLEPTNEAYAVAKIAGLKMCQAYHRQFGMSAVAVMPTNLYGPNDNFDLETSHVLPALLRKFDEARASDCKAVTIWGSGRPRREFLHVDDLASACLYLLDRVDEPLPINIGWGEDIAIAELARMIAEVVGFRGELVFDESKPDGTPRKLLDTSRLRELGWVPAIRLREGIEHTYQWYRQQSS